MDAALSFPTYLQGISAFDADWTNVKVTNNVVITSTCSGIGFSSIHNGLIAHNTVVDDGRIPTAGCAATVSVGTRRTPPHPATTPWCATISRAGCKSTTSITALCPITTLSCWVSVLS